MVLQSGAMKLAGIVGTWSIVRWHFLQGYKTIAIKAMLF